MKKAYWVIFIVIAVVATAGLLYIINKPIPAVAPVVVKPIMKIYENKQYGFNFEYPENLYQYPENNTLFNIQSTPKQLIFGKTLHTEGDYATDGYKIFIRVESQSNWEDYLNNTELNKTPLSFENLTAVRYDKTAGIANGPIVSITDPRLLGNVLEVGYMSSTSSPMAESIINQILSSFKFTN